MNTSALAQATEWSAVVLPSATTAGRWLVCRRNALGWMTVESDHPNELSAHRERRRLQAVLAIHQPRREAQAS